MENDHGRNADVYNDSIDTHMCVCSHKGENVQYLVVALLCWQQWGYAL